jgi:hypothetical protein
MPHCDGYEGMCMQTFDDEYIHANIWIATRLIRKHTNPEIRNILIIAMTVSFHPCFRPKLFLLIIHRHPQSKVTEKSAWTLG